MFALAARFLGPQAAKAIISGLITTGTTAAFTDGFNEALIPFAHTLGATAGGWVVALGSFLIGYLPTWTVPNKKPPAA